MSVAPVPAAAVGVAPAPVAAVAGVFQLLPHCEPPQMTICERCECHKQTVSFPTRTQGTLRNVRVKKCMAATTNDSWVPVGVESRFAGCKSINQ